MANRFMDLLSRRQRIVLAWIALPSVVATVIALLLACWHIATPIVLQAQATALQFTPAPDANSQLWDSPLAFDRLVVKGLQKLGLPGDWTLTQNGVAVPSTTDFRVWLGSESPRAELSLLSPGWLNNIRLPSGISLRLQAAGQRQISLQWPEQAQTLLVVANGNTRLTGRYLHPITLDQARIDDLDLQFSSQPSQPFEITAQALNLTLPALKPFSLTRPIPLAQLAFSEQASSGESQCTLRGELKLRYPDLTEQAAKNLPAPTRCQLKSNPNQPLQLSGLQLNDSGDGFTLSITGSASELSFDREEYRLTALQALWTNDVAKILFAIVVWVASVALGSYQLYKEERST